MGDAQLLDRSMMIESKGESIGIGKRGAAYLKSIEEEQRRVAAKAREMEQLVVLKEFFRCIKNGDEVEVNRMIKDKYVDHQNINTKHPDDFDCTVLHHAARYDRETIFKKCIDTKADINCLNRNKDSILQWCATNNKRNFIDILFKTGNPGDVNINYQNWCRKTALDMAIECGYKDIERLIRKYITDTEVYKAMKAEEARLVEVERQRQLELLRKKEEEERHAAELMAIQLEVMNQAKNAKFAALAKPKKVSKNI